MKIGYIPVAAGPSSSGHQPKITWHETSAKLFWCGYFFLSHLPFEKTYEIVYWVSGNYKPRQVKMLSWSPNQWAGHAMRVYFVEELQEAKSLLEIHFRKETDAMAFKLKWM